MLGHLRMNVDDAIDALINVATAIFPEGSQDVTDPEANSKKTQRGNRGYASDQRDSRQHKNVRTERSTNEVQSVRMFMRLPTHTTHFY
jgi:hypothetical protein